VDGTGTTLRNTASVFGTNQSEVVPENPEQGRVCIDIDLMGAAVDLKFELSHGNLVFEELKISALSGIFKSVNIKFEPAVKSSEPFGPFPYHCGFKNSIQSK
jgi:hypothetical protein